MGRTGRRARRLGRHPGRLPARKGRRVADWDAANLGGGRFFFLVAMADLDLCTSSRGGPGQPQKLRGFQRVVRDDEI
jgi:hypothetical protein